MADRAVRGQQTFELVLPGRGFRHDPDQEFFVLGCEQPVFEKGLDQACRRRRRTTVQVLVLDPVVHRFFRGGNERVFDAEAAHVFFDDFGASCIFEQDVASVVVAVRYAVSQQFRYRNRKVPPGCRSLSGLYVSGCMSEAFMRTTLSSRVRFLSMRSSTARAMWNLNTLISGNRMLSFAATISSRLDSTVTPTVARYRDSTESICRTSVPHCGFAVAHKAANRHTAVRQPYAAIRRTVSAVISGLRILKSEIVDFDVAAARPFEPVSPAVAPDCLPRGSPGTVVPGRRIRSRRIRRRYPGRSTGWSVPPCTGSSSPLASDQCSGAGAATRFVGIDDAIFLNEYDAPHLRQVLLLDGKRMDRPVRTYVRADGTVEIAESAVEIHYRLHYPAESVFGYGRFQYVRRAFGDT